MPVLQYFKLDNHHGGTFGELQVGEHFLFEGNVAKRVEVEVVDGVEKNAFVYSDSSLVSVNGDLQVVVVDRGQLFFGDDTVQYIGEPPAPPVVEQPVTDPTPQE